MNDEIVQDGKRFVVVDAAAKEFGRTREYLMTQCRLGKIEGRRIGRVWYVSHPSMVAFVEDQKKALESHYSKLAEARAKEYVDHQLVTTGVTVGAVAASSNKTAAVPGWYTISQKTAIVLWIVAIIIAVYAVLSFVGLSHASDSSLSRSFFGRIANLFSFGGSEESPANTPSAGTVVNNTYNNTTTNNTYNNTNHNTYNTTNETITTGISEEILSARVGELDERLTARITSLTSANTTNITNVYQTLGSIARGDNFNEINITSSDWTGGTITNASISGGSLSGVDLPADDLTGVVAIANGGTGTSTAPTYGKLLLGNSSGTYDLVATSSLGITGGSGSPGGADTYVQFNSAGSFGGSADFTFNSSSSELTVSRIISSFSTSTHSTSTSLAILTAPRAPYFIATSTTASVFPYASTTALTVSGTASTTLLIVSGLNAADCDVKANSSGVLSCGTDATGTGTFSFTTLTNYSTTTNATSTPLWFQAGVFASSTSHFVDVDFTNATTTSLYIGSLTGPLQASGGQVSASSTLSVAYGGTGLSTFPTYGQILVGNGLGYTLTATSSLGINFATTSADYWITQTSIEALSDVGSMTESYGDILSWNGTGWTNVATSSLGLPTFAYLFPNNATTTGLGLYASTTIGAGGAATGLTINGGATTTGNMFVQGSQTISGSLTLGTALSATNGGTGQSTYSTGDILYASAANTLSKLPIGSAGQVLKIAGGVPTWGTDVSSGGGGGSTAWSTTTDNLALYVTDTSDVVIIGDDATTTQNSILEVIGKSYFSDNVGIGSTTPGFKLTVEGISSLGNQAIAGYFTATTTSTNTFPHLLSTNATTTSLYIGSLTGPLQASGGQVSASSTLSVAYGGTGLSTFPTYGQILVGNGTGYTLTATSSLGLASFAFPFTTTTFGSTAANATSTLIGFNSGLYALASSTIGNGSAGLTIFGTATTTGASEFFGTMSLNNNTINEINSLTISDTGENEGLCFDSDCTPGISVYTVAQGGYNGFNFNTDSGYNYVFNTANVGIGTTTPTYKLSVEGSSTLGNQAIAGYFTATTTSTNTFPTLLSTNATTTALGITGITNSLLATNANGVVIASTTIGANLLTGTLATINSTTITAGGSFTITAASSTLLSDNNRWTGQNVFTNASTTLLNIGSDLISDIDGDALELSAAGVLNVNDVTAAMLASADFGEFTCNGTTCTLDAESQSIEELSDVGAMTESYGDLLTWNGTGWTNFATSSLGLMSDVSRNWRLTGTYLAPTTTVGVLVSASSTIGGGGAASGLTIWGGATTTGTAYFGSSVGIGTTSPLARFSIFAGATDTYNNTLLAVSSSTAAYSTSTLFSISAAGLTTYTTLTGGGATTTDLAITNRTNTLLTTNANGSIIGTSTLSVFYGGTGLSTFPTYGQILVGNGLGYTLTATSSLGLASETSRDWQLTGSYLSPTTTVGILVNASSTIGNGAAGLTVNGNATTTGNFLVGTSTPHLYVNSENGYVGVGTKTPTSIFTIETPTANTAAATFSKSQDTSDSGLYLEFLGDGGSSRGYIGYTQHGGGSASFFTGELADAMAIRAEGSFQLGTGGNNIRLTALSTGNIGIGDTSPASLFTVGANDVFQVNSSGAIAAATGITSSGTITFSDVSSGPLQSIGGVVSATSTVSVAYGGTGLSTFPTYGQILVGNGLGYTLTATSSLGLMSAVSQNWRLTGTYLSPTSTVGILVNASSTIGNTAQTGGLTISGGATTTGNAYIAGNVGVGTAKPYGRLAVSSANLAQTWELIGTGFSISTNGIPFITALSPNRVAFIDAANDSLRTYEFNGATWSLVGSGLSISGVTAPAITALSPNRIVLADSGPLTLRVYEFSTSTWSQVGSTFSISGSGILPSIVALSPNRVAYIDEDNDDLRVYDFNGSTWSQVGTDFTISSTNRSVMAALSPNRIAHIDPINERLTTYEFNGVTWVQVGNGLTITGVGATALTALSPTRVAFIDDTVNNLEVYEFDGSNWFEIGTQLNIGVGIPSLAALSPNRVALFDHTLDILRTYQFSSPLLYIANSQDYPFLAVSDAGFTTAEAFRVRTDLRVGQSATSTTASSSPALTVNGRAVFSDSVGLGTSTPWAKFSIIGSGAQTNPLFHIASSSQSTPFFTVTGSEGFVGIGTSTPAVSLNIHASTGNSPAIKLDDADISLPDYSGVLAAFTTNQLGYISSYSSTVGGMQVSGFTESGANTGTPLALVGYHGGTSPTTAAVNIIGYKHDGGTSRAVLGDSEILAQISNGISDQKFTVLGSGNVGIGTTTPEGDLDIADSTAATLYLRRASDSIAAGNGLGRLFFAGNDGGSQTGAEIRGEADGTWSTGDAPARLQFFTTPSGSATPVEYMRITSAGNVGIGTTSPSSLLHIQKDQNGPTELRIQNKNTGGSSAANLRVLSGTATNGFTLGSTNALDAYFNNVENSFMRFGTNNTERIRILAGGNVGIGDTSPASLFTVGDGDLFQVSSAGAITAATGITSTTGGIISGSPTAIASVGTGDFLGGDSTATFQFDASANTQYFQLATANSAGFSISAQKARGDAATPAVVTAGDDVMYLRAYGYDGDQFIESSRIQFDTTTGVTDNVIPGIMRFFTMNTSGVLTSRMTIDENGDTTMASVGSGTGLDITKTGSGSALVVDKDATNEDDGGSGELITKTSVVTDGGTYTKSGYGLRIINSVTETSGTITDTAHTLSVEQTHADSTGIALNLDSNGTGAIALNIAADNTTVDAINVATDATSGIGLDLTASSLTTGSIARFYSNSADTGTRSLVNIVNDNTAASGAVALRVQQDSTADIVNFFDGATEVFTILDGGNVGIASTSPTSLLSIEANSNATTDYPLTIGNAAQNYGAAYGAYGFSNTVVGVSGIDYTIDISDDLIFKGGGVEIVRFQEGTGNVGIGTTTPPELLTISTNGSTSATAPTLLIENSHTSIDIDNNYGAIEFMSNDASTGGIGISGYIYNVAINAGVRSGLTFGTRDTSGVLAERVRITDTGAVGIATSTPGDQLTVGSGILGINRDISAQDAAYTRLYRNGSEMARIGLTPLDYLGFAGVAGTLNDLVIDSSGNVGISTTSPFALLSVAASQTATPTLYVFNSGGSGVSPSAIFRGGAANDGMHFQVQDTLGNVDFMVEGTGSVGIGTEEAVQQLHVDGTNPQLLTQESTTEFLRVGVGETSNETVIGWDDSDSLQLGVYASNNDTTIAKLMSIMSTGFVGIGEDAPESMLHIQGANVVTANAQYGNLHIATTNSGATDLGGSLTFGGDNGSGTQRAFASVEGRKEADGAAATAYLSFKTNLSGNLDERMRITSTGNVGIGTTSPWAKLSVALGSGSMPAFLVEDSANPDTTPFIITASGLVGIGLMSPTGALQVAGNEVRIGDTGTPGVAADDGDLYVEDALEVDGALNAASTVTFAGLAAGTETGVACFAASGVLLNEADDSCVDSSIRFKENVNNIEYGLDEVIRMRPVSFQYTEEHSPQDRRLKVGLIAEEMDLIIPELVFYEDDGITPNSISYQTLTAVLVKATQELNDRTAFIESQYGTSTALFYIDASGKIGIGTTTPEYALHVAGDVAAQSFVNISTEETKKNIETIEESIEKTYLEKLDSISLVNYLYKNESATSTPHLGLIAEDAPEEVLAEGGRGVDLYKFISFLTGAMKSLAAEVKELGGKVAAFADEMVSKKIVAKNTLCIGGTCITETELQELLALRGGSGGTGSGDSSEGTVASAEDKAPVITIIGNNPAHIKIGDGYTDQGALVSDDKDANPGIVTFVDGAQVASIQLDTSAAKTYEIKYRSVDSSGHATEAIRTVIVEAETPTEPTSDPAPEVVPESVPGETTEEPTTTETASETPVEEGEEEPNTTAAAEIEEEQG